MQLQFFFQLVVSLGMIGQTGRHAQSLVVRAGNAGPATVYTLPVNVDLFLNVSELI